MFKFFLLRVTIDALVMFLSPNQLSTSRFIKDNVFRSVYERALDVDHRCVPMWLKYTEMEMKHKQVRFYFETLIVVT